MNQNELKAKLSCAQTLENAKNILRDVPELEIEAVYREIERHREENQKRDVEELDAVSGGYGRD